MDTSRPPSHKSVSVAFACITRVVIVFAAFMCANGCDGPSVQKPSPATLANPSLPRLTLRANELLDRSESLSNVAIKPTRERLVGEWKFRNESSNVSLEWLPHGYVEAPHSNSPDGMLRLKFVDSSLGSGSDTFDVVLDSEKSCIEIYEFGTVKADGSHPAEYLGTAKVVGDNLITVEATLTSRFCEWDIDCQFVNQPLPNKAVNPSGGSGGN